MQKASRSGSTPTTGPTASSSTVAPRGLRDVLDLVPLGPAVALDEVEPAEAIMRRSTQAMSLGASSPEAHATRRWA